MDRYQLIFDYKSAAKDMQIPLETVLHLEKEVQNEFPNDPMLMELHILRALKSYSAKNMVLEELNRVSEVRFKYEDEKIFVYNLNPKFLSFNTRKSEWLIKEILKRKTILFKKYWVTDDDGIHERCEQIRMQAEKELETGAEELKWIETPLKNRAINLLQIFFPGKEIYLSEFADETFVPIEQLSVDDNTKKLGTGKTY